MEYKSPISILKYAGSDPQTLDASHLLKVQKRLLIELDLNGEGTLNIEGQQLTKDDILSLIENLKVDNTLQFHTWIYENTSLLHLLQNGNSGKGKELFDGSLAYHYHFKQFKEFISPYLVRTLGKALSQALQKRDIAEARKLLQGKDLVSFSYFDEIFSKLKHTIKSLIAEIQQAEQDVNYYFNRENFTFINPAFVQFMNELPEGLGNLREELANQLINLSVRIQNKEVHFCYTLYVSLQELHCEEETKKLINKNLQFFIDRKNQSTSNEKEANWGCLRIGLICFVLFIIIRACVGTSSKESYQSPQQGEYGSYSSMRPIDFKNYIFQRRLKEVTEKQLNPVSSDSLSKVWVVKPHTPPMDNYSWLYPNIYKNLSGLQSDSRYEVTIVNQSEYEIVLLLCTDTDMYSAYLEKGEKIKSPLPKGLTLSIYPGKEWDVNKWFNRSSNKNLLEEKVHGVFSKTDSTTLAYLNTVYKYEPQEINLSNVQIIFTSPIKESLKFSQSGEAFKMYEGTELFKKH